jgi:hypothetical protein
MQHKKPEITSLSEAKPTEMYPLKSHGRQVLADLKLGLVDVI